MKTRMAISIIVAALALAWLPESGARPGSRDAGVGAAAPLTGTIIVGQGTRLCAGGSDTVRVDVRLENTPVPVDAAGLDILYSGVMLDWAGFERGALVATWLYVDAVDLGDRIRVGGFDGSALPAGTSGVFVTLRFVANCCNGLYVNNPLCPQGAVDDIATMTPLCGDVTCMPLATRNATWGGVKALFR